MIGINNRNLRTFDVNIDTTIKLSSDLEDQIIVSESGIKTKEDVKKILSSGIKTFLVGESFMRASNPGEELKDLFFFLIRYVYGRRSSSFYYFFWWIPFSNRSFTKN